MLYYISPMHFVETLSFAYYFYDNPTSRVFKVIGCGSVLTSEFNFKPGDWVYYNKTDSRPSNFKKLY